MENVVLVDCAKVMECADSTILSIVEADNSVNVNVARSVNAGKSCNNFELMTEALAQVEKVTGNDIKSLYETRINEEMKIAAANALAYLISDEELNDEYILPKAFDPRIAPAVAKAVADAAIKSGIAKKKEYTL